MQDDFAFPQLRNHFLRTHIVLQDRLACHYLCDHLTVLLVDSLIISQEIKSFDQLDVSSCRGHPIILYHFTAKLFANFCKALQADVDDTRFLGKKLTKLLGGSCFFCFCHLFRADLFYRLLKVPADGADRRTACKLIVFADDHACFF